MGGAVGKLWILAALPALAALAACGEGRVDKVSKRTGASSGSVGLSGGSDEGCAPRPSGLMLTGGAATVSSDAEAARAELAKHLPPAISVRLVEHDESAATAHYDFRYFVRSQSGDDVPVCGRTARVHRVGERWFYAGELPRLDAGAFAVVSEWQTLEATLAAAARSLGFSAAGAHATNSERCFLLDPATAVATAAWDAFAWLGDRPYRVVGNGSALARVESQDLHATGEATVYQTGPRANDLVRVRLDNLDEGETLASGRFKTMVEGDAPRAVSPTRAFNYEPGDPRFAEASVFVHAEQMMAWLTGATIGFAGNCWPISLYVHSVFKDPQSGVTTVNNAEYLGPELTADGRPRVNVGDGDGIDLVNLALDFDVVAHELGHHVVFRRLKSRFGESGVIHEALADYLLFAKTGDNCLGESICPEGSGACWLEAQCLRTAGNQLKLTDPDLPRQAHRRSQFVSGMLWDIGSRAEIGHERLARTVVRAVDYLQQDSGYADLVKAMMAADLELTTGTASCMIYEGAVARGLAESLAAAAVECGPYAP